MISVLCWLGWLFHLTLFSQLRSNIRMQFPESSLDAYSVVGEWKSVDVQDTQAPPCLEKKPNESKIGGSTFRTVLQNRFPRWKIHIKLQQTGFSLRAAKKIKRSPSKPHRVPQQELYSVGHLEPSHFCSWPIYADCWQLYCISERIAEELENCWRSGWIGVTWKQHKI